MNFRLDFVVLLRDIKPNPLTMIKNPILLLLSSAFLVFSCKKSNIDTADQELVLKKTVELFDDATKRIDNSGIKVSIENSNPLISTVTNEQGEFSLPLTHAPQAFALVFEKEGMGNHKSYFKRLENGDLHEMRIDGRYYLVDTDLPYQLGSKSTVTVNSINAEIAGNKLKLKFNISSAGGQDQKYIRILLQKDLPGLNINNVTQNVKNIASVLAVHDGDNAFEFCLECFMYCHQYTPGSKIYITAYGDALYSNWYADLPTGQWKYPNLKFVDNNPVASFEIP